MRPDNTPFVTQVDNLFKKYLNYCGASALFYMGHNKDRRTEYGLRMEAPSIAKEFVDKVSFGRDPEGLLFYDNLTDFGSLNTEKKVRYYCFYNNESVKAVRIDWYALDEDGNQNDEPLCSYLTRHTAGLSEDYIKAPPTNKSDGIWRDVNTASVYSSLHKDTSGHQLLLKMAPIGKEIYFNISAAKKFNIDTMGIFTYLHASDLGPGHNTLKADYNRDRIVFYSPNDSTKMIGFFIPTEALPVDMTEGDRADASVKNL